MNKLNKAFKVFKEKGFKYLIKIILHKLGYLLIELSIDSSNYRSQSKALPKLNTDSIPFIAVSSNAPRLNLVIDSIFQPKLDHKNGTALILATQIAKHYGMGFRIITRKMDTNPREYFQFIKWLKMIPPTRVEFFSDHDTSIKPLLLEVSDQDIFLAASWQSAKTIKSVSLRKHFFHLLQEPSNEYVCFQSQVHYIVNSKLLYQYYQARGLENGIFFEPAFPHHLYSLDNPKSKKSLFLLTHSQYFSKASQLLKTAVESGLIHPQEWDIFMLRNEQLETPKMIKPIIIDQLDWKQSINFIKTVDLGVCFMNEPILHFPLEIAASGGVVLTNLYTDSQPQSHSRNIIPLDINDPLNGLQKAVQLVDKPQRKDYFLDNQFNQSWEKACEPVMKLVAEYL